MEIHLNPNLTTRHIVLALKYLSRPTSIASFEWSIALETFDLLRTSTVIYNETRYTFNKFYTEFIDQRYADAFIAELIQLTDLGEAQRLVRTYNRRVIADLVALGVVNDAADEGRCLAGFCVYWWSSFMKGYVREQTVFRDLEAAEIQFVPHNLAVREERMLPFDLLLEGFKGDIKTSTYFLLVARSYPLSSDFYVTRLFSEKQRKWHEIAIMTPAMWQQIDGETQPCRWTSVSDVLPDIAEVSLFDETLIVVDYSIFKTKVKAKQREGQD